MPRLTSAGPWTRLAVGTAVLAIALIIALNASLPARPAQAADGVLRYLGGEPKTLKEVGERLGLTRERVRQLEHEALAKLGNMISA